MGQGLAAGLTPPGFHLFLALGRAHWFLNWQVGDKWFLPFPNLRSGRPKQGWKRQITARASGPLSQLGALGVLLDVPQASLGPISASASLPRDPGVPNTLLYSPKVLALTGHLLQNIKEGNLKADCSGDGEGSFGSFDGIF